MTTYIQLGRLGDLCNAAKICLHEHRRTKERIRLVVAREFAPFMEAFVTYLEPITFDGTQDELPRAMAQFPDAIALQSWMNPDQNHWTTSYQKESWRRAGKIRDFGTVPLWLPSRQKARENVFVNKFWSPFLQKPLILIATQGISSQFKWGAQLVKEVNYAFRDTHTVVDLSLFKADRPQDLLGLIDRAALLITIDSFPLHLSEASTCPVIAIVNDLGSSVTPGCWAASVPPPQTVHLARYSEFAMDHDPALTWTVTEAKEALLINKRIPELIHAVQLHGKESRHLRANASWAGMFDDNAYDFSKVDCRTAKDIGDARDLPYLKSLLSFAMVGATGSDIVFWCNDDNVISANLPDFVRRHVPIYGACSFRRTEPGSTGTHMGREGFAFTVQWLKDNWESIPDYILGASSWDIGLAALIRHQRGIVTTKANLTHDFFPCDIGEGFIFHEAHPSAWSGANENCPSNVWNRKLLAEWQYKNTPQFTEQLA